MAHILSNLECSNRSSDIAWARKILSKNAMANNDLVLVFVLISAFMHAAWNTVVKAGKSRFLTLAIVDATAFVICIIALPFVNVPSLQVWYCIILSVIFNTIYRLFLIRAYDAGDFGQVYPIVRGVSPIVVALLSFAILNENVSSGAFIGIIFISIGIVSLAGIRQFSRSMLLPIAMAIMAGLFIAAYTIVDAKGVRSSETAFQYTIYLTIFQSIPMPLLAIAKDRRAFMQYVRNHGVTGPMGGVFYLISYGMILFSLSLAAAAKVSALRETSVIIAAIIAAVFFREGFGVRRIGSAVVIFCGILLIKMNS